MNKLFDWMANLPAPAPLMVTFIVLLLPGFIIAGFSACSAPTQRVENHGWRETESPRPDLQCWVRWNDPKSTVCASSLTSTHGASQ